MGLIDDIKKEKKKVSEGKLGVLDSSNSTEEMLITQKLNKLFYLETNVEEEAKFVKMVMLKNGAAKERIGLHASAMIVSDNDFCYREQVLSLFYKMSQGEQIEPGLKRIFEQGNSIHEKWQRLLIRGGLGSAKDMDRSRFAKEYDLSYTPDGANIKLLKKDFIVEIKSVNTFQFKHMKSHPSGKKQCQLYMHLTGHKKGIVLCDDKNTQEFKVFVYDYDPEIVAPFIERLEGVQYYKNRLLKENKMVKGICGSSTCKRALKCNMRDACWNVGKGRIKLKLK